MFGGRVRAAQIQLLSSRVNSCFPAADTRGPLRECIQFSECAALLRCNAGSRAQ
jgi:hypothetical protein